MRYRLFLGVFLGFLISFPSIADNTELEFAGGQAEPGISDFESDAGFYCYADGDCGSIGICDSVSGMCVVTRRLDSVDTEI